MTEAEISGLPTVLWAREKGWLTVQDPVDGTWFKIPAKQAPSGWARLASEAKKRLQASSEIPFRRSALYRQEQQNSILAAPPEPSEIPFCDSALYRQEQQNSISEPPAEVRVEHWSASRYMLFDQCPALFKERYLDGVALEPTEAMCFGQAVHQGLEAHYRGQDGEHAFRISWKGFSEQLGGKVGKRLTGVGLELLNKVFDLDLRGDPERAFRIDTCSDIGADVVGAMDLWDAKGNVIYDFKTTRGLWSQDRAQTEVWQPFLYTWAAWDEVGDWPAFEYIVLNRNTGQLDRFRREWTADSWLEQMNTLWVRMHAIACDVFDGNLRCSGKHGACLECGERWGHEHECDPETQHRLRVGGRL